MPDAVERFKVTRVAMDGSAKSFTSALDSRSMTIHAVGASIEMRVESGGTPYWTIDQGAYHSLNTRNTAGLTFYFTAASGTAEILEFIGLQG